MGTYELFEFGDYVIAVEYGVYIATNKHGGERVAVADTESELLEQLGYPVY